MFRENLRPLSNCIDTNQWYYWRKLFLSKINDFGGLIVNQEMINFIELFSEIVEMEPSGIVMETELETLDVWDSLSAVLFVGIAEEKYNKILDAEEIQSAKTVFDLYKMVVSK